VSVGLIALLDDVAAIAKVAAASLDDVAGQAAKAGAKAAGVVIDDAAVTPRYMTGFVAVREIPIVRKIAVGSLRNKLLILLPAALALSYLLPSAITPLLMIGGAYLCYEGTEKVFETFWPHQAHTHEQELGTVAIDPQTLEDRKVASAIKTDFILSAEIMAIALATLPQSHLAMQAVVLAVVGIGITALVYGAVALIVKADDIGVVLAANQGNSVLGGISRGIGRGLVCGMPGFLTLLSTVGTAAMIWVGGGIVVHGLETYGLTAIGHAIHHAGEKLAHAVAFAQPVVEWIVGAAGAGLFGLALGSVLIPVAGFVIAPAWRFLKEPIRSMYRS
jgi:predicted DNA repair protein MutK